MMLAIIPARGGSKGLPGKNVRPLMGKPLIAYSIEAALEASSVTRVIVTTDSEEIASVARHYDAEVPFMRPSHLAQDDSMAMDTYFFVIEELASREAKSYDEFIALLPIAPLRSSEDIDNAVSIFRGAKADSVISVTEAPVPPQWFLRIKADGTLTGYFDEMDGVANRQVHDLAYVPNGAIYVFRYQLLKKSRQYYHPRTFPYVMPPERSVDIDTLLDFEWAEFLLSRSENEEKV